VQIEVSFPQKLGPRSAYISNIGLGKGLVEAYLSRPDNVVVAAVRDPADHTSKTLYDLPKASSSSVIVVKIDSASETDAADAISGLRSSHNISAIDVVIANAGIAKAFPRVEDAQTAHFLEHFQVNAIGAVILFRAVLPLLRTSQKGGKFIAMGSTAGTIEAQEKAPIPNAVYGPSKAALNWLMKKIHLENEDLIAFPIHPGWVLPY
jgi:norsolorinic acid ketoreductase